MGNDFKVHIKKARSTQSEFLLPGLVVVLLPVKIARLRARGRWVKGCSRQTWQREPGSEPAEFSRGAGCLLEAAGSAQPRPVQLVSGQAASLAILSMFYVSVSKPPPLLLQ